MDLITFTRNKDSEYPDKIIVHKNPNDQYEIWIIDGPTAREIHYSTCSTYKAARDKAASLAS